MSEEGLEARSREVWQEREFGHVLLETYLGEVYSLSLYQTYETAEASSPAFVCRGYCLPSTDESADRLLQREGLRAVPRTVPVEIELSADAGAFHELDAMVSAAEYRNRQSRPNPDSPFSGEFF